MAPYQAECWEDDAPLALVRELIPRKAEDRTKEVFYVSDTDCSYSEDGCDHSSHNKMLDPPTMELNCAVESNKPVGILRRSKYATNANAANDDDRAIMPEQRPQFYKARFPTRTSVVTKTYTRPFTHVIDIPRLFYSPQDVRRFKRQYRHLLRSQTMARERMEWNSRQKCGEQADPSGNDDNGSVRHDNTFWRSKVGRRWSASSSSSTTSCENSESQEVEVKEDLSYLMNTLDPLNDGSVVSSPAYEDDDEDDESDDSEEETTDSSSSYTGIFSSVFDVAREAVSILNGPSSRYYYENDASSSCSGTSSRSVSRQARKPCNTALHLVDTLYLF